MEVLDYGDVWQVFGLAGPPFESIDGIARFHSRNHLALKGHERQKSPKLQWTDCMHEV